MIAVGDKVRLRGVRIDDKGTEAVGKILQVDNEGIAIVELKDRVVGILTRDLTIVE